MLDVVASNENETPTAVDRRRVNDREPRLATARD
jgi:hypothetical protein